MSGEALAAATILRDALAARRDADDIAVQAANRALADTAKNWADAERLVALLEGGEPPPPPDPDIPDDANTVRIGTATYPLAAVNPTRTDYTGGRGPNELVLYRDPITFTTTNVFGTEATVLRGLVIAAVDRQAAQQAEGVIVPASGWVLSGHGEARDWLNEHAARGARVEVLKLDVPPPPPPPTGGLPAKMIAIYGKVWPKDPTNFGDYPSGANVILPSFFQGNPPNMTGWGSIGKSDQLSALAARRAAGGKVILTVGGGGSVVNTTDRQKFVSQFDYWVEQYNGNVDGLDWDIENGSLGASDALWISKYLKNKYGPNFIIMMAPNGTVITQYIQMAKQHHDAGVLDCIGPQTYADRGSGTPWSLADTKRRLGQIIGAGIPESKVSVGMNIGTNGATWTFAQCRSNMASIHADWPGITKAYLWVEPSYPMSELQQWVSDMQAVL